MDSPFVDYTISLKCVNLAITSDGNGPQGDKCTQTTRERYVRALDG